MAFQSRARQEAVDIQLSPANRFLTGAALRVYPPQVAPVFSDPSARSGRASDHGVSPQTPSVDVTGASKHCSVNSRRGICPNPLKVREVNLDKPALASHFQG